MVYPSNAAAAAAIMVEEETVQERKITELLYWLSISLKRNSYPTMLYMSLFPST